MAITAGMAYFINNLPIGWVPSSRNVAFRTSVSVVVFIFEVQNY